MSAPRYRNKSDGSIVAAIQFVEDEPRTHWHVNVGHPVADALEDVHWVQTEEGAAPIADGDYVVQGAAGSITRPVSMARRIVPAARFEADYEAMATEAAA